MLIPRGVFAAVVALAVGVGCGGDDRPSDADWKVVWERERTVMPGARTILDGGEELCGELLGELRLTVPDLKPTPSEALDEVVDAWGDQAENIAFDCPDDPADLDERYQVLAVLEAEIDAGLRADDT